MTDFRYIRMAANDQGWRRPHGGRKSGNDHVGMQGVGHEDWNFACDVWKDGRYRLYFTLAPASFDEGKFNFVLGVYAHPVPLIIGFVENATNGLSKLPEQVLLRRAQEIFAIDDDDLGPDYAGQSVGQIAKRLRREAGIYRVSVEPQDLHILEQPVPVPPDIYRVSTPLYRPLSMIAEEYSALKERVLVKDTRASVDQEDEASFPEGLLVEKLHRSRERSRRVVELAKKQFIERNGLLFCEVCDLEPEKRFGSAKMRSRIIEAHHDVPLSDDKHEGETKVSDLRMVCPTCHRAIHSIRPWLTVERLRKLINLGN